MEKISIIVPIYNIAPYLPRCLESLLAQTYEHLEILCVDDGSTDGSGAIADSFAARDPRVVALHQENGGVTRARFAGLRRASGDWIGFVDGDDYVAPDMFRRLLENGNRHGADISHCGYRMVFPDRTDYYYNTRRVLCQNRDAGLRDLLEGSMVEPGLCNKLFRRKLLDTLPESSIEDLGIRINEDLLMNFYLFREAESAVFEDFCPYHYIVRKGSAANDKKRHHLTDPIRVAQILCRELGREPALYPLALRLYARRLICAATQKAYPEISGNSREQLRVLCREEGRLLPQKERYMAWMAGFALPLYRLVRRGYEMITQVDHKYDLE